MLTNNYAYLSWKNPLPYKGIYGKYFTLRARILTVSVRNIFKFTILFQCRKNKHILDKMCFAETCKQECTLLLVKKAILLPSSQQYCRKKDKRQQFSLCYYSRLKNGIKIALFQYLEGCCQALITMGPWFCDKE
jgi:hypothetical protein